MAIVGRAAAVRPAVVGKTDWTRLRLQQEESFRTKDDGLFKSIFDSAKMQGMSLWKPTAGDHFIDIIPNFAGANHPGVIKGKMVVGDPSYVVDIWIHRQIGPNQDQYICLAKTYGQPCPVCERRIDLRRDTEMDEAEDKALKPSRRVIYNIWDRDNEGKGVQVWEVAHWFFADKVEQLGRVPRGGGYIAFMDPGDGEGGGRHISFNIKASGNNREYSAHQLLVRQQPIPDRILEMAYCVDELLHVPTYEEVAAALEGGRVCARVAPAAVGRSAASVADNVSAEPCPFYGREFGAYQECEECLDAASCSARTPALANVEVNENAHAEPPLEATVSGTGEDPALTASIEQFIPQETPPMPTPAPARPSASAQPPVGAHPTPWPPTPRPATPAPGPAATRPVLRRAPK